MDRFSKLQKLIDRAMSCDRNRLVRELAGLKSRSQKEGTLTSTLQKNLDSLTRRAESSCAEVEARRGRIPDFEYIPELPITEKKGEITDAIRKSRVVIIAGETGSGKTTQIPKFCIAAGRGIRGKIGCTQPRRIAAVNVASRIAEELGNSDAQLVGYKIRFDDTSDQDSIIKVMTDGILLAETQRDPYLNEYDTIIVDEAHERSLNIDFTLGILRDLIHKRKDLKLIITSATIDTEKFSKAFGDAPIIEVSGRMYPVEVRYQPVLGYDDPDQDDQGYVEAAVEAVEAIQRESRHGDILIFMPTEQDITETIDLLRGRGWVGVTVLPLYARLSAAEQAKIFHRGPGRKIIVSTNVAETSLTIPGIKYVVDTGLARIPSYSPRTRTTALPVTPISRSSADQRKGRCGRVENGICIRLYDEENYLSRSLFTSPEILRSNLAEVILRMISLNLGDVSSFPFIDAPSPKSVKDGFDTLIELGAITQQRDDSSRKGAGGKSQKKRGSKGFILTPKGEIMARIPVDPKLSRILIEADERGCLEEASVIASALSISDPRQRPQDKAKQADQKHAVFKDPASDFISLLNIWNSCYGEKAGFKSRSGARKFCKDNYLSFRRMREWGDIHRQIVSVLKEHGVTGEKKINSAGSGSKKKSESADFDIGGEFYAELHKSILAGYLGNIAHKKEKNLYVAAKGRKAMIFPGSGIFGKAGNWIVAAEYVETSQLFARSAATIDVSWLEELGRDLCTFAWSSPHWEKKRGEVVAKEQVSLFGLIIVQERPVAYGKINPSEAGEIFIRHALVEGEIDIRFPFMEHNSRLINELKALEEKTRKRDIVVTEEDIYLFYRERLDRDFYDIRTFAKYLKDKCVSSKSSGKGGKKDTSGDIISSTGDEFLRMSIEDLRQRTVDEEHLAGFPDTIRIGNMRFSLEYDFKPGSDTDGVTLKIPASFAGHLIGREMEPAIEWLVPGLFKEKITALIRNLPKSQRVKLLPVAENAEIISNELKYRGRSLFSELSFFVKERFNADIPPSAWSDDGLEVHLRMRISLRDDKDQEIAASRDCRILKEYSESEFLDGYDFENTKERWERDEITSWDFGDLPISVKGDKKDLVSCELFPALVPEGEKVALRLFKTLHGASKIHPEGVRSLYIICLDKDINALRKDIRNAARLRAYSSMFGGLENLNSSIIYAVTRHLFAFDIRSESRFNEHAGTMVPKLYATGQELISKVIEICEERKSVIESIEGIANRNRNREQLLYLMKNLSDSVMDLIPPDFLTLYPLDRTGDLKRYLAAIKVRAERAVVDLVRDQKKWSEVARYIEKFEHLKRTCSTGSDSESTCTEWSREKNDAVDNFFWMLEEYKVSLFAQELKTAVKISSSRLDALLKDIEGMV